MIAAAEQIVGRERNQRAWYRQLASNAVVSRRVNFYEAGSGQEENSVDWFTLLFEVIQLGQLSHQFVVASVNWCDEAHSQATRFALKLTPELFVTQSVSEPAL